MALNADDEATIRDVYRSFCIAGPDLRWDPDGGAWIPSYAELMAHADLRGDQHSYMASEENFRILKAYESANRIVPLVGDFGGEQAIRAVGRYLKSHGDTVATFYTSNVEGYLRGDALTKFIDNVSTLPIDEHSMFIRTTFSPADGGDARARPDYPDFQTATRTHQISTWVRASSR